MIKIETIYIESKEFKKTYSDLNYMIRKVGTDEVYAEAIDLPEKNYSYEETTEKIPTLESVETADSQK